MSCENDLCMKESTLVRKDAKSQRNNDHFKCDSLFLMLKYNMLNLATKDGFIETVVSANYISQFRTHSKILIRFVTFIGFNKISY